MEWMYETLWEIVIGVAGVVITALAARLGTALGNFWKEKFKDESMKAIARLVVSAVEMMYRELKGEEKLEKAIQFASKLLQEKGIDADSEKIRIFLESALSEYKGAFEKQC